MARQSPNHVSVLNEYEALLEFKAEVIENTIIMELSHDTQWYGFPIMVSRTISTQCSLQEIYWIRRESHQGPEEVKEIKEGKPKMI